MRIGLEIGLTFEYIRHWTLDIGHGTLDMEKWTLDTGKWTTYPFPIDKKFIQTTSSWARPGKNGVARKKHICVRYFAEVASSYKPVRLEKLLHLTFLFALENLLTKCIKKHLQFNICRTELFWARWLTICVLWFNATKVHCHTNSKIPQSQFQLGELYYHNKPPPLRPILIFRLPLEKLENSPLIIIGGII